MTVRDLWPTIEYEVTLRITVHAGRGDDAAMPYEPTFYAATDAIAVEVPRAQRITPGTSYGGPKS